MMTKIDVKEMRAVDNLVRNGQKPKDACFVVGVHPKAFQRWKRKHKSRVDRGDPHTIEDILRYEFRERPELIPKAIEFIRMLEARGRQRNLTRIQYVPVFYTEIESMMHNARKDIMKLLVSSGIVEIDPSYLPGEFSKKYKIAEDIHWR